MRYTGRMRGWKMEPAELTARREALGFSINGLAHELKVSPSSIQRWEAGIVVLQGLMAVGADTILRRLEAQRKKGQPG
jgi:DNA-binding transcriptional regulator YiaG